MSGRGLKLLDWLPAHARRESFAGVSAVPLASAHFSSKYTGVVIHVKGPAHDGTGHAATKRQPV